MADSQKRRGKHPRDEISFHPDQIPKLLAASSDLAWLKTRGYADPSSIKLVGDRYRLNARQRTAVARSTCSDGELHSRSERLQPLAVMKNKTVYIDGFNLLTTIEAALGNGILLIGRDGCIRDMSSMHGNYRVLSDTEAAIDLIRELLQLGEPERVHWLLDKPVSNSGRLKKKLEDFFSTRGNWPTDVQLLADPDKALKKKHSEQDLVVTADSGILDQCGSWINAARKIIEKMHPLPDMVIDFSDS